MASDRGSEIIKEIKNIIEGGYTDEEKKKLLKNIDNKNGNYTEIIEATDHLISGMISKQEFDEKLKSFKQKMDKQIGDLAGKATECAREAFISEQLIEHPELTKEEVAAQIDEMLENAAKDPTVNEILNDKENSATITENENEAFELGAKKEKAKLKKLYDYKVEGQITSGIKELDEFLKIIQPVINQTIIQPWKLIYKTSDKLAESKEAVIGWDKQRKSLKNDCKTLQVMGLMDSNNIPFGKGNSGIENVVAGKFHDCLLKEVNKNVYDGLIKDKTTELGNKFLSEEYTGPPYETLDDKGKIEYEERKQKFIEEKLNEYRNSDDMKNGKWKRTKVFDTTQSYEPVRDAINKVFLDLIKNHCVDKNHVITEDGQKYMEGFMHMIDLFNRDDNNYIKEKYCEDLGYIMSEAKKPSFGKPIWERMDIHEKMLEKQSRSDVTQWIAQAAAAQAAAQNKSGGS